MSGPASSDWMSLIQTPIERRLDQWWPSRRPRIGVPTDVERHLDSAVKSAWNEALEIIGSLAILEPVELPIEESRDIVATLYRLGCAYAVTAVAGEKRAEFDPDILEFIEPVRSIGVAELLAIQRRREEIASEMALLLAGGVDILLTPTMPCLPPRTDSTATRSVDWFKWCPFTPLFNLTRGPGVSVPWPHSDPRECPIGLQVGAAPGHDGLAVAAATLIETAAASRRLVRAKDVRDAN